MKKAKKTNKSEFSNKKISTAKRPRSGSAAVHDVESAGSKSGNTAVTNPEELLDFAVAVAVRLQSCGAETYRVEETVVRIIEAYGIDKSDVFVIPGSIFAGLEDENGQVYSKIRRVKDIDTILDGVELYSAFCRRICAETPPVRQARQLLRETEKSIRKYKLPIAYLGYFLIAAGFAVFFGGTLRDALGSGLCGIAVGLCIQGMGFLHSNPVFKTFVGGFVLAFAAYSLTVLGLCDNADVVSIGAIMILVPGFLFTNSLRDIIYGDTLSGINRLVQVVIIAIALVVGTSAAFGLSRQIFGTIAGSPQLVEHSLAVQCIAGMVGTLGFGLYLNMHGSGIPYCLVGSIISWVVCCLCMRAGIGEATSYLIAAAVSSAYAEIMARIRKFPAIAYLMAALVPLIPGAGLYYTMDFISRSQMNEAWAKGSATAAIAGAVAVGVLLVSTAFRMWGVYKKKRAAAKCGTQTDSK